MSSAGRKARIRCDGRPTHHRPPWISSGVSREHDGVFSRCDQRRRRWHRNGLAVDKGRIHRAEPRRKPRAAHKLHRQRRGLHV